MAHQRLVRGTHDLLPSAFRLHRLVESTLCRHAEAMGCSELQTPVLEHCAVFHRSLGALSDVVHKEMFQVQDARTWREWVGVGVGSKIPTVRHCVCTACGRGQCLCEHRLCLW